MKPKTFMLIAGEASGDLLGAELAEALRAELVEANSIPTADYQPLHTSLTPRFLGAGGQRMARAGVELAFDMTQHAVIGLDALKAYMKFRRLFYQLYRLALERQPDAVICIDFAGFNRRFAHAVRQFVRTRADWFHDWRPKLIQYVSPQVWASRAGRAYGMAQDYDLLLSTFPFERDWYAKRVPAFPVEFVGNPIVDRYPANGAERHPPSTPAVLLLPGSRASELNRHLPVLLDALSRIRSAVPAIRARMVLPNDVLVAQAKAFTLPGDLEIQTGRLAEALQAATVAIASTGTVTMECAWFGVPTIALYKTSWSTFQIGKRIVQVRYLAMPNLLAGEEVFPEFIQHFATGSNIAAAALALLGDEERREVIRAKLRAIAASLGAPGASRRAARAIVQLVS